MNARVLSFVGAVCLALLAVWASNAPLFEWWGSQDSRAAQTGHAGRDKSDHLARPSTTQSSPVNRGIPSLLPGNESSISATPQRLYLEAVTPGRTPYEGVASIGTDPRNPQTYVAGAILVNGARLVEIHSDHVVLKRGADSASLYLRSAGDLARTTKSDHRSDLATVPAMTSPASDAPQPRGADGLDEVIRSMAFYEDDRLLGLQVFPGKKSGSFARLGLKPADVIVEIDSAPVTDAQNAIEYLRSLTEGAAISVRVRRGAATHTLSLDGTLIEPAIVQTSAQAAH